MLTDIAAGKTCGMAIAFAGRTWRGHEMPIVRTGLLVGAWIGALHAYTVSRIVGWHCLVQAVTRTPSAAFIASTGRAVGKVKCAETHRAVRWGQLEFPQEMWRCFALCPRLALSWIAHKTCTFTEWKVNGCSTLQNACGACRAPNTFGRLGTIEAIAQLSAHVRAGGFLVDHSTWFDRFHVWLRQQACQWSGRIVFTLSHVPNAVEVRVAPLTARVETAWFNGAQK